MPGLTAWRWGGSNSGALCLDLTVGPEPWVSGPWTTCQSVDEPAFDIIDDVNQQHRRSVGVRRSARASVRACDGAIERNFAASGPLCAAAAKRLIAENLSTNGAIRLHAARREDHSRCPSIASEASESGFPLSHSRPHQASKGWIGMNYGWRISCH